MGISLSGNTESSTGHLTISSGSGSSVFIGNGDTQLFVDGNTDTVGIGAAASSVHYLNIYPTYTAAAGNATIVNIGGTLTAGDASNLTGLLIAPTLVEYGSGTHARMVSLDVRGPVVTNAGGATANTAAIYIHAVGSGATPTGTHYALWVNDGAVKFTDRTLSIGGQDYEWPSSANAGTYLKTDASGNLSWAAATATATGSGTTGKITKWTDGGAGAIGDSIMAESGSTVTVTSNLVATNLTGTLLTAAQANITSLGTLTGLGLTGDISLAASAIVWSSGVTTVGGEYSIQRDGAGTDHLQLNVPSGAGFKFSINAVEELIWSTGAFAFQQATEISTSQNNLTLRAATGANVIIGDNDDILYVDGGQHGGVGAVSFGNAGGDAQFMSIAPPALTQSGASYSHVALGATGSVTLGANRTAPVVTLRINEPNITLGGYTLTDAASLYIVGAPTEATNNYVLWADAGAVRIDGGGTSAQVNKTGGVLSLGTSTVNGNNASGSIDVGATASIGITTFTNNNATLTMVNSASLYIEGIPIQGTRTAFTNTPYALWVAAGTSRLDGNVGIGGTSSEKLYVSGTSHITGNVGIGAVATGGRLHVTNSVDSWSGYIRITNSGANADGSIIMDAGGMKFRTEDSGDHFYFRNSANTTNLLIQDNGLVTVGGAFTVSGAATITNLNSWEFGDGRLDSNTTQGPSIEREQSTVTNPTLIPNRDSSTTGMGGTAGIISLITGGAERMRILANGKADFKSNDLDNIAALGLGREANGDASLLLTGGSFTVGAGYTGSVIGLHTAMTGAAGDHMYGIHANNTFTEAASGTHAYVAQIKAEGKAITQTGSTVTTNAATVLIVASMIGATNNYALQIPDYTTVHPANVTNQHTVSIGQATLTATSARTIVNAASLYIKDAPSEADNEVTITGDGPYALFVDAGDSRFDGRVLLADGAAGTPAYSFNSDPDAGMWLVGDGEVRIQRANGGAQLTIGAGGLQIAAAVDLANNTLSNVANAENVWNASGIIHARNNATRLQIRSYHISATGTPELRMAHSMNGTVGQHTAMDEGDILGELVWQGSNGTEFQTGARIIADATETWSGSARGTRIEFYTVNDTTTTLVERMRITSAGEIDLQGNALGLTNVGAPGNDWTATALTHKGSGASAFERTTTDTTGLSTALTIGRTTTGNMADGFGPALTFLIEDPGAAGSVLGQLSFARQGADNTGIFKLHVNNAGSVGTQLTVLASGNVGIGTTSPDTQLDIGGSAAQVLTVQTTGTATRAAIDLKVAASSVNGDPEINFIQGSGNGSANNAKWMTRYDSSEGRFLLLRQEAVGDIIFVQDGTDDVTFAGGIAVGNVAAPTSGILVGSGKLTIQHAHNYIYDADSGNGTLLIQAADRFILGIDGDNSGTAAYMDVRSNTNGDKDGGTLLMRLQEDGSVSIPGSLTVGGESISEVGIMVFAMLFG